MINWGGFNHVSLQHLALRFNLMLCRHVRHGSGHGAPNRSSNCPYRLYGGGQIDIKAAEQALGKSQNKDVKAFAEEMVKDHEAVNKKALALLVKLKVKPEANDTSKSLADAASKKLEELSKLRGAAFDKAYAENEVAYHQTVNAQNGELKSLLQTGLKLLARRKTRKRAEVALL